MGLPDTNHTFQDSCFKNAVYCRIHQVSLFINGEPTHRRYPWEFKYLTSSEGWIEAEVHCGPQTFYPEKPKKKTTTYKPPF